MENKDLIGLTTKGNMAIEDSSIAPTSNAQLDVMFYLARNKHVTAAELAARDYTAFRLHNTTLEEVVQKLVAGGYVVITPSNPTLHKSIAHEVSRNPLYHEPFRKAFQGGSGTEIIEYNAWKRRTGRGSGTDNFYSATQFCDEVNATSEAKDRLLRQLGLSS